MVANRQRFMFLLSCYACLLFNSPHPAIYSHFCPLISLHFALTSTALHSDAPADFYCLCPTADKCAWPGPSWRLLPENACGLSEASESLPKALGRRLHWPAAILWKVGVGMPCQQHQGEKASEGQLRAAECRWQGPWGYRVTKRPKMVEDRQVELKWS